MACSHGSLIWDVMYLEMQKLHDSQVHDGFNQWSNCINENIWNWTNETLNPVYVGIEK